MGKKSTVVLTPFRLKVKRLHRDEYCMMDALPGGQNIHTMFRKFIQENFKMPSLEAAIQGEGIDINRDDQRAVRIRTVAESANGLADRSRTIDLFFDVGEFGLGGTLLNVDSMEAKDKGANIADMLPFYARLDSRSGSDSALLVVQEYGRQHAASFLCKRLRDYFNDNPEGDYENYTLQTMPIVPHKALDELSKGATKKIRLWRKIKRGETSEELGVQDREDRPGTLEITLHPPRGSSFPVNLGRFTEISDGSPRWSKFLTIDGSEEEYTRAKIEIEYKGKKRTLDLGRDKGPLPYIRVDVTDDLERDDKYHPLPEGVRLVVKDYMNTLMDDEGWE